MERSYTSGCVPNAGGVVIERQNAVGRILVAYGVAKKRLSTIRGVGVTGSVVSERPLTGGRVEAAGGVGTQSECSTGRV